MLDFNISPYFDDFSEVSKYYRILFKPSLAVQTRELNQLQSQLQNQISKLGKHVFTNGSIVLNSERFYDNDLISIKHTGNINSTNLIGKELTGSISGTKAVVKAYSSTSKKIIAKITSGKEFLSTDNLTFLDDLNALNTVTLDTTSPFARASVFSVNSGVLFVLNNFVYNPKQTLILSDTINDGDYIVGFDVKESISTSDEDESLLDNSQGYPNFAAPGADRYTIELILNSYPLGSTPENFIEIAKISAGELIYVQQKSVYSEIEKELARRTYDESGNYTVSPFKVSFESHKSNVKVKPIISAGVIVGTEILNNNETFTSVPDINVIGNGTGANIEAILDNTLTSENYQKIISLNIISGGSGYTAEETYIQVGGDINKFSAKLEPGKAYVRGYEFETQSPSYINLNKARTTDFSDNIDVSVDYGNFLYIDNLKGLFNISDFTLVELHSAAKASVTDSTQLGTARVIQIQYVSGTVGTTGATYKLYLSDITITTGLFKDVESIVIRSAGSSTPGANVTTGSNISLLSKLDGVAGNDVFLSGTDRKLLVFPLNHSYVKTLRDLSNNPQNDYTFERVFTNITFTAGSGSISTNNGNERFVGGSGAYSATTIANNYIIVVTAAGTSPYAVGDIISPTSVSGGTISTGAPQTLTFNFTGGNGFTASIIANVNANAVLEKTKSLQPYQIKIISSPNTTIGGRDSIGISDIYKVIGIYNTGTTNPTAVTVNGSTGTLTWGAVSHIDVSANYTADDGQRDRFYDHGSLILSGTAPGATDHILVVYNYFSHTNSGFASVDSYDIPYEDIPTYTSSSTKTQYKLADCIDFRPRRANNTTSLTNGQIPVPTVQFQADYSYYLGRIDKIIATSSKAFAVKSGVPSLVPKVPSDEEDGMTLYVVEIPPYTLSLDDLTVKYVENKRYTMRDIGKIEKRVENLEYYTQLSLLEKRAKEEPVVDANNIDKFKNGFVVDDFSNNDSLFNNGDTNAWARQIWGWWLHRDSGTSSWNKNSGRTISSSLADSLNMDYKVAFDPLNFEMRAEALTSHGNYTYSSGSGVKKSGDIVTLNYTEKTIVSNKLASKSININPFDVIAFNGNISLSPSTDTWVDTALLPSITKIVDVQLPDLPEKVISNISGRGRVVAVTGSSSITTSNVTGTQTSSLGSNIVDVQFIPYVRSRTVIGIGSKFKPKTRLYPFMETIPFSAYTKPLPLLITSTHIGNLFESEETVSIRTGSVSGTIVATAKVIIYSPPTIADSNKRLMTISVLTGTLPGSGYITSAGKSAVMISASTFAYGAPIVPDEFGLIGFEFNIPSNTIKSGSRTLRLIDNIDNQENGTQSFGETVYFAQGLLQNKQETILTTRSVQQQKITTVTGYRYDPIAQTIAIDPRFYPAGAHITSVDIFFKSKSATVPVSLELTKTVNGYPESVMTSIPFGIVNKTPDTINVSADGSVATKFTFESPIHLVPGEYAIVLKANTQEYEVFVSEMGRTDLLTNQIISKQPDTGVLFKSQNASTWTSFQEEDLKFNLNIASFDSSGYVDFTIEDIASFDYSTIYLTSSNIVPSKTNINWYMKGSNTSNILDTTFTHITSGVDIELGKINRADAAGSIVLRAELSTESSNVSPAIDIAGLSTVLIHNSINNTSIYVTDNEEVSIGGDVLARYITKPITLNDGFDASNIVVTLDVYKPVGTDIRVYYKVKPTESNTPFENNEWVRMNPKTTVGNSVNRNDYKEHQFYPVGAFGTYGIPVNSPISPRFDTVSIKVCLVSSNAAFSPVVRNFRAIMLDT